jgi:endonuclease-3 related protein
MRPVTDGMKRHSEKRTVKKKLLAIYRTLFKAFGPQHWWPGDTPFEVMVGAVLTQNTAWTNVEKAIANIERERLLVLSRLTRISEQDLATLIRPSGYFNVKARRLKHLLDFVRSEFGGSLKRMFAADPDELRQRLLAVNGIGPETADSILLYAGGMPFFVVDAYTKRVFGRHGFFDVGADYPHVQQLFMKNLPRDSRLYNEYHALIVRTGKEYCKKSKPRCGDCPLGPLLVRGK